MCDARSLDDYFKEPQTLWEECALPGVRALATARFILTLPDELRGRRYYLQETAPRLVEALERLTGRFYDPEQVGWIRRSIGILTRDGLLAENAARALLDASVTEQKHAEQDPAPSVAPTNQILVRVPLVHPIPAPAWDAQAPRQIALLTELTVAARRRLAGEALVTWNNAHTGQSLSGMRALSDVAADAFLAAREVISAVPRECDEYLGFEISLSEKEALIVGDSIGLGLCVAFTAIIKACTDAEWDRRPRTDLAWTGRILPSGQVGEVEQYTLKEKARAADHGGLRGMVVPAGMGSSLTSGAESNRSPFEVIELSHVGDYLAGPALSEPWEGACTLRTKMTPPRRWSWASAVAPSLVIVLVAIAIGIGKVITESRESLEPALPLLQDIRVERLDGRRTLRLTWPEQTEPLLVREKAAIEFYQLAENLAGDRRGGIRLVYGTSHNGGKPGELVVYDPLAQKDVWTYAFTCAGLRADPQEGLPGVTYCTKAGCVANCDQDAEQEIVLSVSLNPESDGFLWLFDGFRDPVGVVHHTGYLEQVTVADLDHDGVAEIIAAGHHNPSRGISLLVLHAEQFEPFRGSASQMLREPHAEMSPDDGNPCVMHMVVPMPQELVRVTGNHELWWIRGGIFELIGTEREATTPRLMISATYQERRLEDYLLSVRVPCADIRIVPTANMKCFVAEQPPGDGLALDLCGRGFLEHWREIVSCTDRVQRSWPAR